MRMRGQRIGLRAQLARRLLPVAIGMSVLIGVGLPGLYFAIESAATRRAAQAEARAVSTEMRPLLLAGPKLWRYQVAKIEALLRDYHGGPAVTVIRILDGTGRPVAEHAYTPRGPAWARRFDIVGEEALVFNNRTVGTAQIVLTRVPLIERTLGLAVLSAAIGIGLGVLAYVYPVRVVTTMEAPIEGLIETAQRSQAEAERLNAVLEQRVQDRTAKLSQRERELNEAKAYLEHLIRASPGIIQVANLADDTVTYVSPNIEHILGYTPAEVVGAPGFWPSHIHPDHRQEFMEKRRRLQQERANLFEYDLPVLHKNGTYRWMYNLTRYEYDERGTAVRALHYGLDVTDRKSVEEAVRLAKEEAERANQAKSDFLSRMSHELRTPLNAILGFAQLLEMEPLSPESRESLEHIVKGGQHLLQLINEVLDIATMESGRMSLSLEPVPLSEVVKESLDLVTPLAAQHGVTLDLSAPPGADLHVMADRQRLKQVVLNLLSNGIKYNRQGGRLDVSFDESPDGRVRLRVRDTGHGIPPEKLRRLFAPFERLGRERVGVDGAGIGLALSKGLVELMGGTIGVDSQVGEGSTFWVDLAMAEDPDDQFHRMRVDEPAPAAVMGQGGRQIRTVLYIEDNLSTIKLIQRVLAQRPAVKLLTAMQGRMGVDLARQHHPDLILLDVHLPDVTGDEVLRRLQEDPETRGIPVVVISADPASDRAEQLLALGAWATLKKPVEVERLLAILDGTDEARSLSHA
jgi:PAS domain S-box-containing protein